MREPKYKPQTTQTYVIDSEDSAQIRATIVFSEPLNFPFATKALRDIRARRVNKLLNQIADVLSTFYETSVEREASQ